MLKQFEVVRSLLLVFFLCSLSLVSAQKEDYVSGKLVDATTKEPIVFATIQLKNEAIGVISNTDGGFRFPLSFKKTSDTLMISSMGYQTKEVLLSNFPSDVRYLIEITPAVTSLEEVVVTKKKLSKIRSAEEVVRRALNRIPQNYPKAKYGYIGYYRDYQLKNKLYYNLNEAIIKVVDQGFAANDFLTSKAYLHQYKENTEFDRDSIAAQPYDYATQNKIVPSATLNGSEGNEFMLLRIHDPIRNYNRNTFSFLNQFDKDFIPNHVLELENPTVYNNKPVYVISISKKTERHLVKGFLYIDKNGFAIRKIDYGVYNRTLVDKLKTIGYFSKTQPRPKTNAPSVVFKVTAEYKANTKDEMMLNYISFYNVFEIAKPPKFDLKYMSVDRLKKQFYIYLTAIPKDVKGNNKRNFNVRYQGKRVPLEVIHHEEGSNRIILVPKKNARVVRLMWLKNNDFIKEDFTVEITNLKDVNGNELYYREREYMDQYREFFVQHQLDVVIGKHDLSPQIKPQIPINKIQNLPEPIDGKRYWMNTPLKQ